MIETDKTFIECLNETIRDIWRNMAEDFKRKYENQERIMDLAMTLFNERSYNE